jgi:hypothetical protein
MYRPNFCMECGERLARRDWRAFIKRLGGKFCDDCARRLGKAGIARPLLIVTLIAASAFSLGRYLRPAPPPLIIQRAANSPLSDLPVNLNAAVRTSNRNESHATNQNGALSGANEDVYICGARTRKGTPCHRRVHFAGERCYQHKGMPALLPLEKLVVKNK